MAGIQKRHEYVTVDHDIDEEVVVHVADDRKQEVLETCFEGLGPKGCAKLEHVAMDLWAPYIGATRADSIATPKPSNQPTRKPEAPETFLKSTKQHDCVLHVV